MVYQLTQNVIIKAAHTHTHNRKKVKLSQGKLLTTTQTEADDIP